MKLQGQNVWLIGASSGIGAALAPKLAAEGARLIISARREEELQKVAASCAPHEVAVKTLDVTRLDEVRDVYRSLVAEQGPLDGLVYSAGTWTIASVSDFEVEPAVQQIEVNYLGLIRVVGTVMPDMIARQRGTIAGVASVAGYAGIPRASAYSSSKAGVLAFLQAIRMELVQHNVDVITISPGFVDTPMTQKNDFLMPFMVEPGEAAERITKGLLDGDEEIHFPRRLSVPLKVATALPRPALEFVYRNLMGRGRT